MTEPRSVRFEPATLTKLSTFAARHPGLSSAGTVSLLVEEGLRMDEHPGIIFRDGPTGRRAVVAGGPDVWEVARTLRDTRAAEPRLKPTKIIELISQNNGLSESQVRVAVNYYGTYQTEIDQQVTAADEAETQLELSLGRLRELLGS